MPSEIKLKLEQVNNVSRQLLSLVLNVQNKAQENAVVIDGSDSESSITSSSKSQDKIITLMSKRDELIRSLFTQNKANELEKELVLLNEMVALDEKLYSQSQVCKTILAEQVIRLKKGKKASKSYQKY